MATSFSDSQGDRWDLRLDIGLARRIRDVLGVDLVNHGGDAIERLGRDVFLLVDVLFLTCEAQAASRGVSDEQFGRRLAGDAIAAAVDAFMEALANFTPSPRRAILTMVWQKTKAIAAAQQATVQAMLDNGQIDAAIEDVMTSGSSCSASPESSASSPTG
jgi:hypothetical protein